jgi:hypothetical protein
MMLFIHPVHPDLMMVIDHASIDVLGELFAPF